MRPVVQVTGPSEGGREGMRGHVGYGDTPASKKNNDKNVCLKMYVVETYKVLLNIGCPKIPIAP